MTKKITIWSTKGGVGKTSICAELHFRLGYPIITNEEDSMLSTIINDDVLKILKPKEKIQNYNNSILFDFGGYIDNRIIDALKQSDFLLIPTLCFVSDLQGCLNTISHIIDIFDKDKIIVVANRVKDNNESSYVRNILLERKIKNIISIKDSKAMQKIYINKCSIKSLMKNNPLLNYAYRKIDKQFDELISIII